METNLAALLHRLKLADFQHNKNPKYRQYASGDDFYTKIGNKTDEMMRVSYFLTKFLTSTPPMLSPKDSSAEGEELMDYDDMEGLNNARASTLNYDQPDDYTLYSLENLPILKESELDSNLVMFHSFIAFIKPATYFIHKHEMVPPTRGETSKENVTRVLMNLVQLLIFARSVTETNGADILAVIYTLFYKFPHYFTIQGEGSGSHDTDHMTDETIQGMDTGRSFFEAFSEQAAQFFIVLLAYDNHDLSIEQFREEINMFLSSQLTAHSEDFREALTNHQYILQKYSEESTSVTDCCQRLKEYITINDFKGQILEVAKTLTTKVLKKVREISTWDLETTYLDMNYQKMFADLKDSHNMELNELRSKIEKEVQAIEEQEKNELRARMSSAEQESKLLLEQSQLHEQEIKFLQTENARLKEELNKANSTTGRDEKREFKYQDLEKLYPELIVTVKNQTFRMATKKAFTRIEQLEAEVEKLRGVAESSENDNASSTYQNVNGSYTAREPDQVEEPEFYEQSITSYNNNDNNGYYNRVPPPAQRGPPPYFNNDRVYRPPTRGGAQSYRGGMRGGGGVGSRGFAPYY